MGVDVVDVRGRVRPKQVVSRSGPGEEFLHIMAVRLFLRGMVCLICFSYVI